MRRAVETVTPMTDNRSNLATVRPYRRDVMKILGAGAAVGAFGGVAAADEHDTYPTEDGPDVTNGDDDSTGTVFTVRTLIRESTNPQRPADFIYQPTGLRIEPGDVIRFVFETPDHNVTSYHPAFGMQRRVPPGVQPFSSPIMGWDPRSLPDDIDMPPAEHGNGGGGNGENDDGNGENDGGEGDGPRPSSWLYAFETPGVYDLECAPHEGFGMVMRVVVGEETETAFETSDPGELPPPRAGPVGLAREVLTDPNLEPETIVEHGRVEWEDLESYQEPGTDGEDEADDEDEADGDDEANGDDETDGNGE